MLQGADFDAALEAGLGTLPGTGLGLAIVKKAVDLHGELRDARSDTAHRAALVAGGGKSQVPCLLITAANGSQTWLYESNAINAYLEREFGTA